MGIPVKITVIGAGSATFSMGLVRDLCLTENLAGSHITLMDIDSERLASVHRLAVRYNQELGGALTFSQTTNLAASLREADFVINTAGSDYDHLDERVRLDWKHGYVLVVLGLTFRNLRPMLEVAREIERVCPDAWLIQSGNPVYEGTTLITRETGVKIIGLCHGHGGYYGVAQILGLNGHETTWTAPGLNHNIWLNEFRRDGQDLYPVLDRWIENEAEAYWKDRVEHPENYLPEDHLSRAVIDQYRRFGLLPIGDTTRGGSWWYKQNSDARQHWYGAGGGIFSERFLSMATAAHAQQIATMRELAQDASRSVLEVFPPVKTFEQQVPIIDALTNDVEGRFQINVPNRGAVPGVPDDVVAEMPAYIDKGGIHRIQVQPLPRKLMLEVIHPVILDMEWQLELFRTGDRDMLLDYLLSVDTFQGGPRTTSYQQAKGYLDKMLSAPYNRGLAEHFTVREPSWARVLTPKYT